MRAVYIGVDTTNPTLILRVRSFLRAGVDVTSFAFRRAKYNTDFEPEWSNVHLGYTRDRKYARRLPNLLRALFRILKHKQLLREADFIYGRNFDLFMLGLFAKWLSGSKATLVYEVEDVQEIFFKKTLTAKLFRWIERRALKHANLLVLMSPGFYTGYFKPVQGYAGPYYVLENKLQLHGKSPDPTALGEVWKQHLGKKWVIGWFGTLRCPKSMHLLERLAQRLGDKVEIYTRGYPTETGIEAYNEIVDRNPNWTYEGEYTIPGDLEDMYGRVHFSWCLDFLDEFGNSPLLLACRMYQGGFYGSVPLAVKDWEMDRWLSTVGIGHTFSEDYVDQIADFLTNLDVDTYLAERADLMARRDDLFLEDGRYTQGLLDKITEIRAARA